MQGKRIVRLGDREYEIEETFGGEYAVYVTDAYTGPVDSHVRTAQPAPGTLVVILARVAGPVVPMEVERRNYREVCWHPVKEGEAQRALGREYGHGDAGKAAWRSLRQGSVVGAGVCQYRRKERDG